MSEPKMFDPPPPGKIVTRKWKGGKLVSEEVRENTYEPNSADLDLILIGCECGHEFEMPYDCKGFLHDKNMFCGGCGESGKFKVLDSSPNRIARGEGE